MAGVIQVVRVSPKSPVNKEDGWMRGGALGKKQIPKLLGRLCVRDARVGFGWGERQNILRDYRSGRGQRKKTSSVHATILLKDEKNDAPQLQSASHRRKSEAVRTLLLEPGIGVRSAKQALHSSRNRP